MMWFGAEFTGLVFGFLILEDDVLAVGAAIGGVIVASVVAFAIVGSLPPRTAISARWRRAVLLFDLEESHTSGEIQPGDLVHAPVAIQPGDLLRLEPTEDGRVRLQTVFEDEVAGMPGTFFRVEPSTKGDLPRLVPAKDLRPRVEASDNPQHQSTQIQIEPPAGF
jgi:hypothetical protein